MSRASYKTAIDWIVLNDDIDWLTNGDPASVTASLVADLFNKTDAKVHADLLKARKRIWQKLSDACKNSKQAVRPPVPQP